LAFQRVLWVLCLSAQGLLIVAILQRKLLRAYPFFVAYLVIDFLGGRAKPANEGRVKTGQRRVHSGH
jgi:hypothetical protein